MSVIAAFIMLTASLVSCSDSSSKADNGVSDSASVESVDTGEKIIATGYIGDTANGGNEQDIEWKVYSIEGKNENGKEAFLEIKGKDSARMKSFTGQGNDVPAYYQYREQIGTIVVKNVSNIGENAFCDTVYAHTVRIENSVTEIGKNAFKGCENLVTVQMSDKLGKLGDCAFQNCVSLSTVKYMGVVVTGDTGGFNTSKYYSFPDSLTEIGQNVFDGCSKLTLKVKQGSKAEEYAKQNNIKYEAG